MASFGTMLDSLIERIVVDYRGIFVCVFLLPLSLVYDVWEYVRSWVVFQLNTAPKNHIQKVATVQAQVKNWAQAGKTLKMCTARPGWQTISFRQPKYKSTLFNVSVNLVDIIQLDVDRKTVLVEPMVTMGQLSALLQPLGWTIAVLPELDDLTVGGLVNGTGIETSSHKFGLFQHICNSFEIVLPSAEVVTCSKDENTDLFYSIPWSYGTLGFLTAVELQIIPATQFIKLNYFPAKSLEDLITSFNEQTYKADGNQFVEGIMFSKTEGVVMVGNMSTSAEPTKINRIGQWHKPWFFKHVESFLNANTTGSTEYIPLRDYFHRHSRSIFWEIQEIIPFGNHPVFRYLLGWMSPPKISLLKLTQTKSIKRLYESHHMIQDILVPLTTLKDSLELFDETVQIYPLWLCPFKLPNNPGMLHPQGKDEEMFVDIGAYGIPRRNFDAERTTRVIEAFARKMNGYQMLYADTYMTKDEFREMFDHSLYDKVRSTYGCTEAFPEIYDKVSRQARI